MGIVKTKSLSLKHLKHKNFLHYLVIFTIIIASTSFVFYFQPNVNNPYNNPIIYAITFILIGFSVQLVGTAYSLITVVILFNMGMEPVLASTTIHIVSIFTAGSSSFSHWKMGNVNKKVAKGILPAGIIGVIIGAYILISVDGKFIKPFIAIYLLIMGLVIFRKGFEKKIKKGKLKGIKILAFFSGFLDSIGGGGWGAIMTATMLGKGKTPRYTLGTVNFTKFFITLTAAGAFLAFAQIDPNYFLMMLYLIIGGVPASYISAYLVTQLPSRYLMLMVGIVIILLSLNTIFMSFV